MVDSVVPNGRFVLVFMMGRVGYAGAAFWIGAIACGQFSIAEPAMSTLPKASVERQILGLSVGEKISLARKGDQEARRILVRDANRQVATAVV